MYFQRWHLGATRRLDIGLPSPMRIPNDLRRCVAIIGYADGPGGVAPLGTCFFLQFDGRLYLVTAQHIASDIGDSPFVVRINRLEGDAINFSADPLTGSVSWLVHETERVDIAALPFGIPDEYGAGVIAALSLPESIIANLTKGVMSDVEIGDMTYTVGLFRLLSGAKRNLPVAHCGNVALLAGEEPIPVHDWLATRNSGKSCDIEAHLIEQQSLAGLSGSPVFVRPPLLMGMPVAAGPPATAIVPGWAIKLLGVWQGAWDAEPEKVLAMQHGKSVRVPVGMGVVTPISKLVEILNSTKAKQERQIVKEIWEKRKQIPQPDSIEQNARTEVQVGPEATNPAHKEDFTALLGEVAQPPAKGD